ncbi:hypothetical protein [Streptomyces sp. NPDC059455]
MTITDALILAATSEEARAQERYQQQAGEALHVRMHGVLCGGRRWITY